MERTDLTIAKRQSAGPSNVISRYPLVFFVLFAYLFSWTLWLPLYLPRLGGPPLPVLPYPHAWGGLGPLLSAFLVTYATRGTPGLRELWQRMVRWKVNLRWHLVAWLSPFALFLLAAATAYFSGQGSVTLAGLGITEEFPEFGPVQFLLYNLLFFGYGEETGWRGFALPRLQARWNALWSSVWLTLIWAAWHIPLFLYRPDYTSMAAAGIVGWVLSLVTGSLLLTWLYNSSRGSILIVAAFHATIDIAFTSVPAKGEIISYLGMLITVWALVVLISARPENLSKEKRQTIR